MSILYRWLTRVARRVGPAVAPQGSKLRTGLEGRARAHESLAAWGRRQRDPERPLVWFHAPSVGEGLQAQAVIDALRLRRPEAQIAFTHFSPSAIGLAKRIDADVATYLPWDLPEVIDEALEGLAPSLIVFTKTEVWPELVARAADREVPSAIVGASVPPGAGRARWPARALLRPTWGRLQVACASTVEDAVGLRRLGVREAVLSVTGDPGIDSAARRAAAADPSAAHLSPFLAAPTPTVVAGSTWPTDEAVILPALAAARERVPELRLIVAPHEPTPEHVSELTSALTGQGWSVATLSAVSDRRSVEGASAIVVDSVGVLAHLYSVGDVAYVGGGFHDEGLHSVLEPAAAAKPVVFGPRHHNARAADELLTLGGAKIASDTGDMHRIVARWLGDSEAAKAAGSRAFTYIETHRGAADRTAALLEPLI